MSKMVLLFVSLASPLAFAVTDGRSMVRGYRELAPARRAQVAQYFRAERLDPDLIETNAFQRGCELILSPFGRRTSDEKAMAEIRRARVEVREVLRRILVEKESPAGAYVTAMAQALRRGTDQPGLNEVALPEYFKSQEVEIDSAALVTKVNQNLRRAKDALTWAGVSFERARSVADGALDAAFTLVFESGDPLTMELEQVDAHGAPIDHVLTEFVTALITHRGLLADPVAFNREINALNYDLKKLLRVTSGETAATLQGLIGTLEPVDANQMHQTSYRSRAFARFIEAKRAILILAQAQAEGTEAKIAAYRKETGKRPDLGYGYARSRIKDDRPLPAGMRGKQYRHVVRRRDEAHVSNDDDIIATYGWITDPYFMLTHPWYWGTSDGDMRAPFLLWQLMQDRDLRHPGHDTFDRDQGYDPRFFDKPLDPVYHEGRDVPVSDPWDAPLRPDVVTPEIGGDGVTWRRADGSEAIVDQQTLDDRWSEFVGGKLDPYWKNDAPTSADQPAPTGERLDETARDGFLGEGKDGANETDDQDAAEDDSATGGGEHS